MKKVKIMIGDNTPSFHLIASEGKVLQRISDKQIFGYEIGTRVYLLYWFSKATRTIVRVAGALL